MVDCESCKNVRELYINLKYEALIRIRLPSFLSNNFLLRKK